jgi:4-amino-4-deoxy-L-arabinose transferase-like glycosyltransferase
VNPNAQRLAVAERVRSRYAPPSFLSALWTPAIRDRAWLGLWAVLCGAPLLLRGPLPPDELRYLSVAWEMWSRGDLLLPVLNGVPYADKPPLLFWLMHAGWAVFGVSEWWPRLLPGLFALTTILLMRRLGRALWPENSAAIKGIPWLLLGSLAWALYSQVVLFDLLLANWTLLGLLGLVSAERGNVRGWAIFAAAIALGLLTKGPATLLHLAGPALLAPWWARAEHFIVRRWYARFFVAVLAGSFVALAWALLAALRGGSDYAAELLLGQTAGRLVESFAHSRPFWFYLWTLPLLLFPWSLWPWAWRAMNEAFRTGMRDRGSRLLLTAAVPTFVAFSAISGKQPHYLLPLVPLLLLLAAVSFSARSAQQSTARASVPFALGAAVAGAGAYLPSLTDREVPIAAWSSGWGTLAALLLLILALAKAAAWPTVVRRWRHRAYAICRARDIRSLTSLRTTVSSIS